MGKKTAYTFVSILLLLTFASFSLLVSAYDVLPKTVFFNVNLTTNEGTYSTEDETVAINIKVPEYGFFVINAKEGMLSLNNPALPGPYLDLDATDGVACLYIPGGAPAPGNNPPHHYTVYVQGKGNPGGSISWGESWRGDTLWQQHSVTRLRDKPFWEGPWTTYFNIGYNFWFGSSWTNNGISNLQMRWFPIQGIEF
jgi:hypothetical protein